MHIASKFLTAPIRVTGIRWKDGKLLVEGLIKDYLPMTVEMGLPDVRDAAMAAIRPLRDRVARHLPSRLRRFVAARAQPPPSEVETVR